MSSPARGTWVEIGMALSSPHSENRRLPHGGRGLKFSTRPRRCQRTSRRLPHGGRGLK